MNTSPYKSIAQQERAAQMQAQRAADEAAREAADARSAARLACVHNAPTAPAWTHAVIVALLEIADPAEMLTYMHATSGTAIALGATPGPVYGRCDGTPHLAGRYLSRRAARQVAAASTSEQRLAFFAALGGTCDCTIAALLAPLVATLPPR